MYHVIFAGAVAGAGAIGTLASGGDLAVGAGTALSSVFGAAAGVVPSYALMHLNNVYQKLSLGQFFAGCALFVGAGMAAGGVMGFNSMMEDKNENESRKISLVPAQSAEHAVSPIAIKGLNIE
jgi:hypothetical protein